MNSSTFWRGHKHAATGPNARKVFFRITTLGDLALFSRSIAVCAMCVLILKTVLAMSQRLAGVANIISPAALLLQAPQQYV